MTRLLLCILLSLTAATAQGIGLGSGSGPTSPTQPQTKPAVRPEDQCSIEGTVINAATGEPLRKAHLRLQPMGQHNAEPYGTTTDAAGHYEMTGIDPGRYFFEATRTGFVTMYYTPDGGSPTGHRSPAMLTLTAGQQMNKAAFKMIAQAVITGRVVDEDGDPMPEVNVQVSRYSYIRGKKQLLPVSMSSTNDLGEFRIYGVPPGKYYISATARDINMGMNLAVRVTGGPEAQRQADQGYGVTYYPNGNSPQSAAQVQIIAGQQMQGIDFSMSPIHVARIRGHVVDGATGKPAKESSIMLMNRDNAMYMSRGLARVLDDKGAFELHGIAPGSYTLIASSAGGGNDRETAELPIDINGQNIDGVVITLQPPMQMTGKIAVDGGAQYKGRTPMIFLQPRGGGPSFGGGYGRAKDDMTFTLDRVNPGSYDVAVPNLEDGYYVKSVRVGDQDVTDNGFDVTSATAGEINITISPNAAEVDGLVKDASGNPVVGATVTLVPDTAHRGISSLYKTASTDQNGHYTIKSIRPGEYKAFAWDQIDGGAVQDADFLKPHETEGTAVTLKESGKETADLKVLSAQ